MEGILIYNEAISRPDLVLSNGSLLGGLHCGDCLEVWINEQWVTARLELSDNWVIISKDAVCELPYGQSARFCGII